MKKVTIYEYTTENSPEVNYILESEYSVCVSTNGDPVFYDTIDEAKADLEDAEITCLGTFDGDEGWDEEWLGNHVGVVELLWYRSL